MPATSSEPSLNPLAADEHGVRLLVTDLRIVYLLLNEARYRSFERLLGVSREQANAVTLIVLLLWAEGTRGHAQRMREVQPPNRGDVMLGAAVLREGVYGIGGAAADQTRMFGVLIALAVVGRLSVPAIRRGIRGVRTESHRLRANFSHRYGHLVPRPARPDRFRRRPPDDRGYLLESEMAGTT
jgi:hypothetical protein